MPTKKLGRQTVALANPPALIGHANVVGKKEGDGPLKNSFDHIEQDDTFGEKSWEKAETAMQKIALAAALDKAGQAISNLDYLFAGDLLNQCIGSGFAIRGQDVPFFGLYGACSTMGEGLSLASMSIDGGFAQFAGVVTSSHFCSAERQYRTPLEYGGQRTPTAQWTSSEHVVLYQLRQVVHGRLSRDSRGAKGLSDVRARIERLSNGQELYVRRRKTLYRNHATVYHTTRRAV